MAIIYRCDRCNSDFNDQKEVKSILIPHVDRYSTFTDEDNRYIKELCGRCWFAIIELTKPLPKVSEAR